MKRLLVASAILEGAAGTSLVLLPSLSIYALLGASADTAVALWVTRAAGVTLLSLSSAYWQARNDSHSAAARGLVLAMLLYNGSFILLLGYARFNLGLNGIGLLPGILLHATLVIWCMICLQRGPRLEKPV